MKYFQLIPFQINKNVYLRHNLGEEFDSSSRFAGDIKKCIVSLNQTTAYHTEKIRIKHPLIFKENVMKQYVLQYGSFQRKSNTKLHKRSLSMDQY